MVHKVFCLLPWRPSTLLVLVVPCAMPKGEEKLWPRRDLNWLVLASYGLEGYGFCFDQLAYVISMVFADGV